jgi:mRNA interferase RelE/StbE
VPYRIEFLRSATRELASLPKSGQRQIAAHINALADKPRPHGVKKLEGQERLYRIRAGDYRVLYEIDDDKSLVTIITIGNRRDVYRNL